MEMKNRNLLFGWAVMALGILLSLNAAGQGVLLPSQRDRVTVRTEHEIGNAYRLKQSVLPITSSPNTFTVHEKDNQSIDPHPWTLENDKGYLKTPSTNAFIVNVGRNFEGNHLTGGTPSDNTLAISNDGIIVSVDNYSIAYFHENGDTITHFGLPLSNFYNDSTMDQLPFDPRVLYDSYENRFILVSLFHSINYTQSRLLLSFSKPLTADTVEWYHYQYNCDSAFTSGGEGMYWFDYPNISLTKSQFLVAMAVRNHDSIAGTNPNATNLFLQLDKGAGYAGSPNVATAAWKGIENTEGEKRINLVPSMDALQSMSSDSICYLVSNYRNADTKFFWFEVEGAIGSPTASLTAHATFPAFFYSTPSYASQLGGNGGDRISVLDCDIQYCLLQNNKLHFVFTRSNNGWAELVYASINIATNAFFASTFDRVADNENLLLPSIACYGVDSTDENYLIAFLRTGPNQFPEICAINYDSSGWAIVPTSVKNGFGILDLRQDLVAPWDSLERWGDYTCIQRRYSDPYRRCWMVGAHAFGLGANHFGIVSGVNAWIAELGDTAVAASPELQSIRNFEVFPNPIGSNENMGLIFPTFTKGVVHISDLNGRIVLSAPVFGESGEISMSQLPSGTYFVTIIDNRLNYAHKRIVVCR
jgi:hypothetical protein